MKKLFTLTILALVFIYTAFSGIANSPTKREDAPFGLSWGMSIKEAYDTCISMDLELGEVSSIYDVIPPDPYYYFSEYSITIRDMGLIEIEASREFRSFKYSEWGKDSYSDPLRQAKICASEDYVPYGYLVDYFGKPDLFNVFDRLETDGTFSAYWNNELIRIMYYVRIFQTYDSYNDRGVRVTLDYALTEKGKTQFGKFQEQMLN